MQFITVLSMNIAELPENCKSTDDTVSEIVMSKCASCDESYGVNQLNKYGVIKHHFKDPNIFSDFVVVYKNCY
jgi:hypothetical protein